MMRWSDEKDSWLSATRGIRFQDLADALLSGGLVDIIESPGRHEQQAFLVKLREYIWVVPFVLEKDGTLFLKTAYPSRKMMERYGGPNGKAGRA
jgi:hypothetical protein